MGRNRAQQRRDPVRFKVLGCSFTRRTLAVSLATCWTIIIAATIYAFWQTTLPPAEIVGRGNGTELVRLNHWKIQRAKEALSSVALLAIVMAAFTHLGYRAYQETAQGEHDSDES